MTRVSEVAPWCYSVVMHDRLCFGMLWYTVLQYDMHGSGLGLSLSVKAYEGGGGDR